MNKSALHITSWKRWWVAMCLGALVGMGIIAIHSFFVAVVIAPVPKEVRESRVEQGLWWVSPEVMVASMGRKSLSGTTFFLKEAVELASAGEWDMSRAEDGAPVWIGVAIWIWGVVARRCCDVVYQLWAARGRRRGATFVQGMGILAAAILFAGLAWIPNRWIPLGDRYYRPLVQEGRPGEVKLTPVGIVLSRMGMLP